MTYKISNRTFPKPQILYYKDDYLFSGYSDQKTAWFKTKPLKVNE